MTTEGEINGFIKEYLEFRGLNDSAGTLVKECNKLHKPLVTVESQKSKARTGSAASKDSSAENKLLSSFKEGNADKFFEQWPVYTPTRRAESDTGVQKLEFYLHLYFAVWDIKNLRVESGGKDRQGSASSQSSLYSSCPGMLRYREYLESPAAASLSQAPEFLPLFALPYVKDPTHHPSYVDLFTEKWSTSLRGRLEKFLRAESAATSRPRLLELLSKSDGEGAGHCLTGAGDKGRGDINNEGRVTDYHKKFTKAQAEYRNIINITASLVDTLELCIQSIFAFNQQAWLRLLVKCKDALKLNKYKNLPKNSLNVFIVSPQFPDSRIERGHAVMPEYMEKICTQLFDDKVRQTNDFSRPGTAGNALRQSILSNPPVNSVAGHTSPFQPKSPPSHLPNLRNTSRSELDIEKIKTELMSENSNMEDERRKSLLLQALRWRLTKVSPGERDVTLEQYISEDIIGCRNEGPIRYSVIEMIENQLLSEELKQSIFRFLNCLASLRRGRVYLSLNSPLILTMISYLKGVDVRQGGSTLVRDQLLGCLQKLSLKRDLQLMMINERLVVFLVDFLISMDLMGGRGDEGTGRGDVGMDGDGSDYMLEYAVALLMNLCLRSAGKRQCVPIAEKTLKLLSSLLTHPNIEIIPYVNGALYSILGVPEICTVACGPAVGLEKRLTTILATDQRETRRQLEFVLKHISSTNKSQDLMTSDDEDDDDDEEDQEEMEGDLDFDDVVKAKARELCGESLLVAQYSRHFGSSGYQQQQRPDYKNNSPATRKKQEPEKENTEQGNDDEYGVLCRPVTPGQKKMSLTARVEKDPSSAQQNFSATADAAFNVMQRPPTRSGSRPSSAAGQSRSAVGGLKPATGETRPAAASANSDQSRIKPRATGTKVNSAFDDPDYEAAFGARSKVLRTPDIGGRPNVPHSRPTNPPDPLSSVDETSRSFENFERDGDVRHFSSTMPAQGSNRFVTNTTNSSLNSDILEF